MNEQAGRPSPELVAELDRLVESANETPAWVERQVAAGLRLVDDAGVDPTHADIADRLSTLAAMPDACPQVVDVPADVELTRAVWDANSLLLTIATAEPDPSARTMFRVVRAEPRMWYMTGIDGATNEVTQQSMIVWLPRVDGVLEFVPGSY